MTVIPFLLGGLLLFGRSSSGAASTSPGNAVPASAGTGFTAAVSADRSIYGLRGRLNDGHRRSFYIGPDVGVFFPVSSKTRSRFGSSWLDIGASIGPVGGETHKGRFGFDFQLISGGQGPDYAYLGLFGAQYRRALVRLHPRSTGNPQGGPTQQPWRRPGVVPYLGASVDLALAYMRSVEDNVPSGVQSGAAGTLFLGVNFGSRAYLEARWLQSTNIRGFDFSGAEVSAGYRIRF
ncbi:MAG TPA: hypothetical protein VGS41_03765 [Chthonomonadales bacterium]|nr:hypothetical protein [Chthonomonadales bacterium]